MPSADCSMSAQDVRRDVDAVCKISVNNFGIDALKTVLESLDDEKLADNEQVASLRLLLQQKNVQSLVAAYDNVESQEEETDYKNNTETLQQVLSELEPDVEESETANELNIMLKQPHFRRLVEALDRIANRKYRNEPDSFDPAINSATTEAVRVVVLQKFDDQPLGITISSRNGHCYVARILHDSMIHVQGLLHIGDCIEEVDGQPVTSPEFLQDKLRRAVGSVTLKITPSYKESMNICETNLKAYFNYYPEKDPQIPTKDAGLEFEKGDILEIVNLDDENWWQARVAGKKGTGIIPSPMFEERRKSHLHSGSAIKRPNSLLARLTGLDRKLETMYVVRNNMDFERHGVVTYEEVVRVKPGFHKCLYLLGAKGVGKRTIKTRLVESDPERLGIAIPYTTRPAKSGEEDGVDYHFVAEKHFRRKLKDNQFLEWGRYQNNYYGTRASTVKDVMNSGKMVVLDLIPEAIKALKSSNFKAYVVFIASPSAEILEKRHEDSTKRYADFQKMKEESDIMEQMYGSYIDETILNLDPNETYEKLKEIIERLQNESSWVPTSWVY
ncbi:expressed hypothetical protein [Trichoplax adhaerens]|uniref:MAGUK p55 subfamily member 2 n=1 Tax=Trichoplax adhaerens TaxID=10228 RepID=B3RRY4_TRIAD|nr:expressed hypothetical protein [Trichoplax adhaerens]EDV26953.1 expressed hypothetical protein [Trichoplax adhaerens]|eukprot:XP_002110949.1 expressed hypothetical protein [Trichoplax adhaerens]